MTPILYGGSSEVDEFGMKIKIDRVMTTKILPFALIFVPSLKTISFGLNLFFWSVPPFQLNPKEPIGY
jgi:hypothetical protein